MIMKDKILNCSIIAQKGLFLIFKIRQNKKPLKKYTSNGDTFLTVFY